MSPPEGSEAARGQRALAGAAWLSDVVPEATAAACGRRFCRQTTDYFQAASLPVNATAAAICLPAAHGQRIARSMALPQRSSG